MTAPTSALQRSAATALLAAQSVLDLVSSSKHGPAVFAPNQDFDDVFDRLTIDPPQWLPKPGYCGRAGDLMLTVNAWSQGPDASLKAADLADAALVVLDADLVLAGWRVSSRRPEGCRPIGDPDATIGRVAATVRYSVQRTA